MPNDRTIIYSFLCVYKYIFYTKRNGILSRFNPIMILYVRLKASLEFIKATVIFKCRNLDFILKLISESICI